jgi:hypothetical protein
MLLCKACHIITGPVNAASHHLPMDGQHASYALHDKHDNGAQPVSHVQASGYTPDSLLVDAGDGGARLEGIRQLQQLGAVLLAWRRQAPGGAIVHAIICSTHKHTSKQQPGRG